MHFGGNHCAPEQGKWTRPAVPIPKYSGAICDFQMFIISSDKASDFPPEEVWIIERSGVALDFQLGRRES